MAICHPLPVRFGSIAFWAKLWLSGRLGWPTFALHRAPGRQTDKAQHSTTID